jgi:hypothetical protein
MSNGSADCKFLGYGPVVCSVVIRGLEATHLFDLMEHHIPNYSHD